MKSVVGVGSLESAINGTGVSSLLRHYSMDGRNFLDYLDSNSR